MKKTKKMAKKWTKEMEDLYEYNCEDNYDEEYCYDTIARFDDSDWDDGESEEERYI